MFKKDSYSVFIFFLALLVLNVLDRFFFTDSPILIYSVFFLILCIVFLLTNLDTIQTNKYLSILKKAFKIVGLSYLLLFVALLLGVLGAYIMSLSNAESGQEKTHNIFNKIAEMLPAFVAQQIMFLVLLPFFLLAVMFLREKFKPEDKTVIDHLVN